MRVYFFFGRNDALKSGVSFKIWKIERRGRDVHVWWGRAIYNAKTRRPEPERELSTKKWRFNSDEQAIAQLANRIDSKLKEGLALTAEA
jgi:predicted DNA-binding WGR domain protein